MQEGEGLGGVRLDRMVRLFLCFARRTLSVADVLDSPIALHRIILTLLLILILVLAVRSRGGSGSGWKGKLMRGLDGASGSDEEDDRSSSRDVARRTMRTN